MKVSPEILNLVPYKTGKPIKETQREYGLSEVYKLASNENPLGVSPKVKAALAGALGEMHRYPDPACYELVSLVSEMWKVPREKLSVGNGSNEIIDLLIRIYCAPGESILTYDAAFVAYAVCAQAARVKNVIVPYESDFRMDLQRMAKVLRERKETDKIRLVFLPNPNNPTGVYIPENEVHAFLKEFGHDPDLLIVFDEAYTEFVRAKDYRSALSEMNEFKNVVVIRTLSKAYALAGLRVGILVAPTEVIDLYNRVRNPFNVNELAQVAAVAALQDQDFVRKTVELTWQGLDYFAKELEKLGVPAVPSQANFVLFDTRRDVKALNEALLRKGVILRPVLNYGLMTHLRMSVGTETENRAAIRALSEVLLALPELTSR